MDRMKSVSLVAGGHRLKRKEKVRCSRKEAGLNPRGPLVVVKKKSYSSVFEKEGAAVRFVDILI